MNSLVSELADYDDRDPSAAEAQPADTPKYHREMSKAAPPKGSSNSLLTQWQGPTPILCLGGKGPLDELAATMLAQLLAKHGLPARLARYQAASRDAIASMDVAGITLICISFLDIRGNPSHLRYLVQRLRRRAPGVPILVGVWPAEEEVLVDGSVRTAIGADYYVTSLREAVDTCVAAAQKETPDNLQPRM